jgi:hypothetical protein
MVCGIYMPSLNMVAELLFYKLAEPEAGEICRKFGKFLLAGMSNAEGENPMHGVANLADVMLVLVVGIMPALVINWNIDIALEQSAVTTSPSEIILEIESFNDGDDTEIDAEGNYEKMDV